MRNGFKSFLLIFILISLLMQNFNLENSQTSLLSTVTYDIRCKYTKRCCILVREEVKNPAKKQKSRQNKQFVIFDPWKFPWNRRAFA